MHPTAANTLPSRLPHSYQQGATAAAAALMTPVRTHAGQQPPTMQPQSASGYAPFLRSTRVQPFHPYAQSPALTGGGGSAAVTSRYFGSSRVLAPAHPQTARLPPTVAGKLRPLLRHGQGAGGSLFRLPELALAALFAVKQSNTISPDLLQPTPGGAAFVLTVEKEMEWPEQRAALVQRCAELQKQHRHLYVLYLKDAKGVSSATGAVTPPSVDHMVELSPSLPPVLTCSTLEFMVLTIGIVARTTLEGPSKQLAAVSQEKVMSPAPTSPATTSTTQAPTPAHKKEMPDVIVC